MDKLDAMKYDGRRLDPREQHVVDAIINENQALFSELSKTD